jgi:hypothetical protein
VGALVSLGLACGTKLNAGVLVPVTVIFVAILPAPLKKRVSRALLVGTIPAAVFVAVNPYLWPQPFARTLSLIRGWGSFLQEQQADPVHAAARVVDRLDALDLVVQRVLLLPTRGTGIPGFPGSWAHALAALLALVAVTCFALAAFRWSGKGVDRRQVVLAFGLGTLAAPMTWEFPGGNALVALLLGLGAWRLVTRLRGSGGFEAAGYFTLVLLTTLVATWLWLPFDWQRYYLPALGLTPVLGGLGAIEIEQALSLHMGARRAFS